MRKWSALQREAKELNCVTAFHALLVRRRCKLAAMGGAGAISTLPVKRSKKQRSGARPGDREGLCFYSGRKRGVAKRKESLIVLHIAQPVPTYMYANGTICTI